MATQVGRSANMVHSVNPTSKGASPVEPLADPAVERADGRPANLAFQVDLRGVIDLLAKHLYTTREVFIRELLQNAVDAISMRRQLDPHHEGRIRFELLSGREGPPTLTVEDDGIGLTEEDIHRFLSTIGASSKRDAMAVARGDFLGQFGIGILSCFMVGDELVIVTRSAKGDHPTMEWRGRSDGTYSIRKLDMNVEPGTRVYLKFRPDPQEEEPMSFDRLRELVRHYGEMLPVEVVVADASREVKTRREGAPWTRDGRSPSRNDLAAYAREAMGLRPLEVIPIEDEATGLSGAAFILPTASAATARQAHRIYLRGMFLSERVEGLVPEWAFFVRCVFNTTRLRPTAAREGLYRDQALEAASEAIGRAIRDHLVMLARKDRDRLEKILAVHDLAMRGLAADDDAFFAIIIDFLSFETTMGRMRFGDYRRENFAIRLAPTDDQFRQLAPVAMAQAMCVFNGGYTYHAELLTRAAQHFDLEQEIITAADVVELFDDLTDEEQEEVFGLLRDAGEVLAPLGCEAAVRRFRPPELPALYGADLDVAFFRSLEQTREVTQPDWSEVIDGLKKQMEREPRATLCFNHANEVIRALARLEDAPLRKTIVGLLFVQSLLLGHHALSGRELGLLNEGLDAIIQRAVKGAS